MDIYVVNVAGKAIASFISKADRDDFIAQLGNRHVSCATLINPEDRTAEENFTEAVAPARRSSTVVSPAVVVNGRWLIEHNGGLPRLADIRDHENFICWLWDDDSTTMVLDKPLTYLMGAIMAT